MVCKSQRSQPKLIKIVSQQWEGVNKGGDWVDACAPEAVLSVDQKANEHLLKSKDYKKVKTHGK